ncbi:hypothetical protein, partial [Vibrio parahaemolyticus]
MQSNDSSVHVDDIVITLLCNMVTLLCNLMTLITSPSFFFLYLKVFTCIQSCADVALKVLQKCFKSASKVLQKCFKSASKVLQKC